MNSRKTLFLVVLVGLAGGLVVWDRYKGTTTDEQLAKHKRLVNIDAKVVTHVELVHSNQTIVLDKSGDNWNITAPLAVRADVSAVNSILDELEFADRKRTLTASDLQNTTLREFGLDPARLTIRLQGKKGPVILRLGSDTPTKDALYAQVEGRPGVSVVGPAVLERAGQGFEALRSRVPLEFVPANVSRLEIKATDRSIELSHTAATTNTEARWMLSRPLTARADTAKVNALLDDLSQLRILDFVSDEPKDVHTYHLEEPDREVSITSGTGGQTLLFGHSTTNDPGKVYAKVKGADAIFTVSADVAKKFAVSLSDVRDPRLLTFDPATVKSIELARGADKFGLQREGEGWMVTGPYTGAAEADAVGALLDDLAGLRAKTFTADIATDLDQYGLATPAMTVELPGIAELLVGGRDVSTSTRYVKRADEPFIYGVDTGAVDRLPANYGAVRSRVIFDLKPEQIQQWVAGDVTIARGADGKWNLVVPAQGLINVEAANAAMAAFATLRAESFGPAKTEGDAAGGLKLQTTIGDATYWVTVATNGVATASTVELTFQLPADVVKKLTTPIVMTPQQ